VSFSPVSNIPPPSMARAVRTHAATIPITTYRLSQKRLGASRVSLGRGLSGMLRLHVPSSACTTNPHLQSSTDQSHQCRAASSRLGSLSASRRLCPDRRRLLYFGDGASSCDYRGVCRRGVHPYRVPLSSMSHDAAKADQLAASHLTGPDHRAAFSTAPLCGVWRSVALGQAVAIG
jgi:hypothetical protein